MNRSAVCDLICFYLSNVSSCHSMVIVLCCPKQRFDFRGMRQHLLSCGGAWTFCNEKLISKGEKRKLYRWVCFLKDAVSQTQLLSGNDVCKWLHMRSSDLPHNVIATPCCYIYRPDCFHCFCFARRPNFVNH